MRARLTCCTGKEIAHKWSQKDLGIEPAELDSWIKEHKESVRGSVATTTRKFQISGGSNEHDPHTNIDAHRGRIIHNQHTIYRVKKQDDRRAHEAEGAITWL